MPGRPSRRSCPRSSCWRGEGEGPRRSREQGQRDGRGRGLRLSARGGEAGQYHEAAPAGADPGQGAIRGGLLDRAQAPALVEPSGGRDKVPETVRPGRFQVASVQGLYELMRGVDTDYPRLAGFWNDGNACQPEVRNGMLHLLHPANRTYQCWTPTRCGSSNRTRTTRSWTLESVNHGNGAVVDLSDEQNRDRYTA